MRWTKSLICLSMLAFLFGCSGEPRGQMLVGTATLDGGPLTGCWIAFQQPGKNVPTSLGVVSDGKFSIDRAAGAEPGRYDVYFVAEQPDLEDYERMRQSGGEPFPSSPIPQRYSSAGVFTATVGSGNNSFHFELKSQHQNEPF